MSPSRSPPSSSTSPADAGTPPRRDLLLHPRRPHPRVNPRWRGVGHWGSVWGWGQLSGRRGAVATEDGEAVRPTRAKPFPHGTEPYRRKSSIVSARKPRPRHPPMKHVDGATDDDAHRPGTVRPSPRRYPRLTAGQGPDASMRSRAPPSQHQRRPTSTSRSTSCPGRRRRPSHARARRPSDGLRPLSAPTCPSPATPTPAPCGTSPRARATTPSHGSRPLLVASSCPEQRLRRKVVFCRKFAPRPPLPV